MRRRNAVETIKFRLNTPVKNGQFGLFGMTVKVSLVGLTCQSPCRDLAQRLSSPLETLHFVHLDRLPRPYEVPYRWLQRFVQPNLLEVYVSPSMHKEP
jgi:hypothetical protein